MRSIAIIGLGLIGGSIAKAVKQNSETYVIGWNRNESTAKAALKQGIIDTIWDKSSVLDSELIIIAAPPEATVCFLEENAHLFGKGSVITDVCGVKTQIVAECERICIANGLAFIGGHPMAGKEKGGLNNSDPTLFERASYILTPSASTPKKAMDTIIELTEILKVGRITVTTPEEHDRIIAFTSQLPHVLAGAYIKSPLCKERKGFSAGSFMDVSRVATADEKLWTELFMQNRVNLCKEIETLIKNLTAYHDAIKDDNRQLINDLIKEGREIKEADND
ncbi:MAG: prephenate dehydrogenase/arogenate dehydrogenase family protein [Firmicutes bacterium HGW-Firmicutes-21]|nr:MAG: prephenate dehydrogenase/arogenate dehydrogenase family protein [Firmicutes bacterium HGW-Firmicutes-21]